MSEDKKVISLQEMRHRLRQQRARSAGDIRAEMDYRTEKVLEFMDEQQRRIERLEANLRAVVRILKNSLKDQRQSPPEDLPR